MYLFRHDRHGAGRLIFLSMKSLLASLLLLAGGLCASSAQAQTSVPVAAHVPAGVVTYTSGPCAVSAELNKYEIRRYRQIGLLSAADARLIRGRKRVAARQERHYQKAEAAKLRALTKDELAQR